MKSFSLSTSAILQHQLPMTCIASALFFRLTFAFGVVSGIRYVGEHEMEQEVVLSASGATHGIQVKANIQSTAKEVLDVQTEPQSATMSCPDGGRWEHVTCGSLGWQPTTRPRKIYDGFCYNGEHDILRARLQELSHVIDGTAALLTERNFKGNQKSDDTLQRLQQELVNAASKSPVKHLMLNGSAFDQCRSSTGALESSFNSRCAVSVAKNSVATALENHFDLEPEDWIIFGDPDEIPNREFIRLLRECEVPPGHEVVRISAASHFMYDLRCEIRSSMWLDRPNPKTPVALRVATMRAHGLRIHQAQNSPYCVPKGPYASECSREEEKVPVFPYIDIPCGMWHLSSFGGLNRVHRKVADNANRTALKTKYEDPCSEKNADRHMVAVRNPSPTVLYPRVPHSVSEDLDSFDMFLDAFV